MIDAKIRREALRLAVAVFGGMEYPLSPDQLITKAVMFEDYIRHGSTNREEESDERENDNRNRSGK